MPDFALKSAGLAIDFKLHEELLEISDLLHEALRIEEDILRRLSEPPRAPALLRELWWYEDLVYQLAREYGMVAESYLAEIRAHLAKR